MRHLILTLDFPPLYDGGIARSMDETARALAGAGESVRVLTRGKGGEVASHDASYPASVTRFWGHHWQKFHPWLLAWHLPRVGRQEQGAVVHASTWEVAAPVLARAPKFGWKVCVHAQGREVAGSFADPGKLARMSAVFKAADAILPISRHLAELAVRAGAAPEKTHLITPAIQASRVQGGDGARFRAKHNLGTRPVLLTLARLVDRKGQDTVIRALPAVLKEVPDLVYVLAGGGDHRPALEQLAKEHRVSDHVVFAGFVDDAAVPDVYAAADAYVMVSREGREAGDIEGFGITYLEASATGLPVIAGNTAGAVDAVADGATGLLVPPTDVAAVSGAILRLFKDRAAAKAMGQAGKDRVARDFTLASRAAKILSVCGSPPPAR